MAIEKNSFKVSRFDSEFSPRSRDSMSSDDEEFQRRSSAVESDDDDEFDDCDSGAGSDDFDLLELGEIGDEFCQVGDQTCSIPFELYDLPGLGDVVSMDVWNDVLTEEERFNLTKYLPDMDQEMFMRTLKELFTGSNFHFGSPINKLFDMLKGGLCEPRIALYHQGLVFFQKREHYHLLRKHQNSMVINLYQIRDAWLNCRGYSIEEKLRVLNIMKSQKSLMYENMGLESDSSEREESGDVLWSKKLKDRKLGPKISGHGGTPTLEFPSRRRQMGPQLAKVGKQNTKGTLKLAGSNMSTVKELSGHLPSGLHGMEMKLGPYPLAGALPKQNKIAGIDSGASVHRMDRMRDDSDAAATMYDIAVQRDRNFSRVNVANKAGTFKGAKKQEGLRSEEYADNYMGFPVSLKNDFNAYGRNRIVNQLSDIEVLTARPSNARITHDYGKKFKYPETFQQFAPEDQMKHGKVRAANFSLKGSGIELSDEAEPFWPDMGQGEVFSVDPSIKYGDLNAKGKKWKVGRDSKDINSYRLLSSGSRTKPVHDKGRTISVQNGGRNMPLVRGNRMFPKSMETESDSSEQFDEDEDDNPLMRSKWAYPSGIADVKSRPDYKMAKLVKKDKKGRSQVSGRLSQSIRKMGKLTEDIHMVGAEEYSSKGKQKGKMHDIVQQNRSAAQSFEDSYFSGPGWLDDDEDDDQKPVHKLGRKVQLQGEHGEKFRIPSLKSCSPDGRRKGLEYSVPQLNELHDYTAEEDDLLLTQLQDNGITGKLGKKSQTVEASMNDRHERSDGQLLGCSSLKKKRKVKDEHDGDLFLSDFQQQLNDITFSKKRGKRKLEDDVGSLNKRASESPSTEMAEEDLEPPDAKPQKKPFTLITPTVHTGFSFSIIHLLSAVRMALITLLLEDSLEVGNADKNDGREKLGEEHSTGHEDTNGIQSQGDLNITHSRHSEKGNLPSLTVQEIVNRVRSNPGDPCILETQEPLQDLVRGVLKIFSSKTAPLGAKGWKPLLCYKKSAKSWSWVGPVLNSASDHDAIEEVTSPEAWGLPYKMLVKLVDSFANWLKNGQETLQQIGSLPAPPATLTQSNWDEKERFRDLRAQKSLSTINPSSEEVRAYFRKEEVLRYSIPDRAFSYTAVDGRKSIVAPLRRCGGKPTSKARDHFMLKRDRPPHVTILCLVRDAAARLPGSIGTRADVCTLIRDSQYIVEDVNDNQVNQVVSGALDRLHYERDPCVQFDSERKLWVYLHREREEEDFEDDGTSSTKKWKRQKKEAAEPFEQDVVTLAFHGSSEQTGVDLSSDLNLEPSLMDADKGLELGYYDHKHPVEDSIEINHGSEQVAMHQGSPMVWDALGLNSMQDNRLLCQENSTNEDFDDETFGTDS